jgi:hypothetical protein
MEGRRTKNNLDIWWDSLDGDRPIARPVPTQDSTTQKRAHRSTPRTVDLSIAAVAKYIRYNLHAQQPVVAYIRWPCRNFPHMKRAELR